MKTIYSHFIHQKLNGLLHKQLDRDEMNAIGRLYMQLSYSWFNSFVRKNQESTMNENDFEIPMARILHFASDVELVKNCGVSNTAFTPKLKLS